MKQLSLLILLLILSILTVTQSCVNSKEKQGNFSDDLSADSKSAIVSEILDLTTNWANAHINMDADKAITLWDPSSDLMFAENGAFFANRDSIYTFLKGFYQSTTSMDVQWVTRTVVPLSLNAASLSGYFHFKAVFKTGNVFEGNSMFTGVFIRKDNKWVLIHGHESYK